MNGMMLFAAAALCAASAPASPKLGETEPSLMMPEGASFEIGADGNFLIGGKPRFLIGNLYYVDNALAYLNKKKKPSKNFMTFFYIGCIAVIFVGALIEMDLAWALADITMGCLTLINIPCCLILSGIAVKALKDFESQKKRRLNPTFKARNIGLDDSKLSFWK